MNATRKENHKHKALVLVYVISDLRINHFY